MATGFSTGSAAPYSGDTSIKDVAALFAAPHSSLDMGGLSTEEQQALVEVAAQVRWLLAFRGEGLGSPLNPKPPG